MILAAEGGYQKFVLTSSDWTWLWFAFAIAIVALVVGAILIPDYAHASLETSLGGIKTKLTGVILPLLSVIGIAIAGISFFTGNPNAKQHIAYAIVGSMIGFGAQSIVDFISQTVR
jgi:type IV secretory pathway VirB2 component (pilin)